MSEYKNVVGGRLKLKGKPLDVKDGAVKKKKKKHRREESSQVEHGQQYEGIARFYAALFLPLASLQIA
jgi:protein FAM32A